MNGGIAKTQVRGTKLFFLQKCQDESNISSHILRAQSPKKLLLSSSSSSLLTLLLLFFYLFIFFLLFCKESTKSPLSHLYP